MNSSEFANLPVYRQALEIFKVSRAIACSISNNTNIFEMQFSSNSNYQFASEIVSDSMTLAPELARVQNIANPSIRLKRINRIRKASGRILSKSKMLEYNNVKEKEFLHLLKEEIQQFEELLGEWLFNLHMNNRKN